MRNWIWIELIGFDNTLPDCGVGAYLDNCGFVPEGVSLMFTWLEFPLCHKGLQTEYPLSPAECSYGAHPFTPERARQQWTNWQLARLIDALHRRHIQVYCSYLNMACYADENGSLVYGPFCGDKPYLFETRRNGKRTGTVNVLKRLADGRFLEDVLQQKTVEMLTDYGFDGIQIADGISSGRLSLQEGDYADDMVEQFLADTAVALPADIARSADGDETQMTRRADWIWQNHRKAWIDFHCRRWETFYRKFASRLRAADKKAIFNSAWARDPFEAIYRFGVDYRRMDAMDYTGCMVEDVAPGLAILSEQDNGYLMTDRQRRGLHYDLLATLMQNRAAMPHLQILPLCSIHDTMEQWGVLEHMPTSMTRTVLCNLNTLYWNGETSQPVIDGGWFCLGDSLSREQWTFIRKNWEIGDPSAAATPMGVTWVWSDNLTDAEIDRFIDKRQAPGHFLLSQLLYAGAPVHSIVRADGLDTFSGDLMVPNPGLLPQNEQEILSRYANGRVWLIGDLGDMESRFSIARYVQENNAFGGMCLARFKDGDAKTETIDNPTVYTFDPRISPEPLGGLWTHPLTYPPVGDAFFARAAQMLNQTAHCPKLVRCADSCEIIAVKIAQNRCRVYVANDEYYYTLPQIDMGRPIKTIRCLTKYEGYKVPTNGTVFTCRVPGRGMEAFEVETEH